MQKLCYILPYYSPDDATHFSHVFDFLQELSKDMDVWVIAERGKVSKIKIPHLTIIKSLSPIRQIILTALLLLARFKGYKNFYIHYSFQAAYTASFITKFFGGTVFYWNCGEPWKYKRNFFRESFERLTYKSIDFLVTGTKNLGEKYSREYNIPLEKIKIMPNWISLSRFYAEKTKIQELKNALRLPMDKKIILFAHRLSSRKGAQYMSSIIDSCRQMNVHFLIVGDGPERSKLKSEIANRNLNDFATLIGAVPNRLMPLYYTFSDIFIMPSDEEGFPRVVLESMAMRIPIAAFDVGSVSEIISPMLRSYVVESGNVEKFTEALKKLSGLSKEEITRIKEDEAAWVSQFDVSKVVPIFKKILMV